MPTRLEGVDAAVCLLDEAGAVVAINDAARALLADDSSSDQPGTSSHSTLHVNCPGHGACTMLQALATRGTARHDAERLRDSEGRHLLAWWSLSPLHPTTATASGTATASAATGAVATLTFGMTAPPAPTDAGAVSAPPVRAAIETGSAPGSRPEHRDVAGQLRWSVELLYRMSLEPSEDAALLMLGRVLVPDLADVVIVDLLDDDGNLQRLGGFVAGGISIDIDAVLARPECQHQPDSTSVTRTTITDSGVREFAGDELDDPTVFGIASRHVLRAVGATAVTVMPLAARDRLVGVVGLIRCSPAARYEDHERALLTEIARGAGLILANDRLLSVQSDAAYALQQALVPQFDRTQLAATGRYRPAAGRYAVGGDWYDVFATTTDRDTTVIAIGDAAGHDLKAATAMAQLKNLLRGVTIAGTPGKSDPGDILDTVDLNLDLLGIGTTATAVMMTCTRDTITGQWRLVWANAGHPPPVIATTNNCGVTASVYGDSLGPLLGVRREGLRWSSSVVVPSGTTIALYTDGLVERRAETIDDGIERLRAAFERAVRRHDAIDSVADALLADITADSEDDSALLVVRLT